LDKQITKELFLKHTDKNVVYVAVLSNVG